MSTPKSSAARFATGEICAGAAVGALAAAARISRSTIRPVRPLPFTVAQSTPSPCATRRARGLIVGRALFPFILPPLCTGEGSVLPPSLAGEDRGGGSDRD